MKKYYTIFLGDKIWENVTDDVHSTESWATSGMVWTSLRKATAYLKDIKEYSFEEKKNRKFSIKQLYL